MTAPRNPTLLSATLRCVIPALLLTIAAGCTAQGGKSTTQPPATPPRPLTLQEKLDDFQTQWRASTPAARAKVYDEEVAQLRASGLADRAAKAGTQAPEFTLPDTLGDQVTLSGLLAQGPVVLLWYRGGWSPYCTIELRAYAEAQPQFQKLGATLVALSPQTLDNSIMTQQLGQIEFPVLSDAGNQVASAYGLVYKISGRMLPEIQSQLNLKDYNGDSSFELPLPATYVIDTNGTIRYAFVEPDYRRRAEPAAVLEVLRGLQPVNQEAGEAGEAGALRARYDITLGPPQQRAVDVRVEFSGLRPDCAALELQMPEGFAYVRLPEPLLDGPIRAAAGEQPLQIERTGPYRWTLNPAGHTSVELAYRVPLTHRELDAVRGPHEFEYPFVGSDSALLVTGALIVYAPEFERAAFRVHVNVPPGWDVCAPWPRETDGELAPASLNALTNDLLAVGRWSTREIRVGEFVGTIAFAPGQDEIEDAAAALISDVVRHELALFGRPPQGRYVFLFGPPVERGMGGSPKTGSMILTVDPRMQARGARHLAHLISHEFFHTWAHGVAEMPDELRWLNEGITDYYAYLVSARLGLLTWEEFAAELAQRMQTTADSPLFGRVSLVEAGGPAFFTDNDARELVYGGGLLIGAWLDRAIRANDRSRSLEDLLRALINDPRWTPSGPNPTMAEFATLLPQFVPADTAQAVLAAIREPYRLDPAATFRPLGVAVETHTGAAQLDFRANFDGTSVIDLDHQTLAYSIGVRENDRLVEVNGRPVTGDREIQAAWRSAPDERVRVKLVRDEREIELEQPLPQVTRYEVPAEPWRAHAAGTAHNNTAG